MSGVLLWVVCPKDNINSLLSFLPRNGRSRTSKMCTRLSFSTGVLAYSGAVANPSRSSEEKVYEVVLKQAALVREQRWDKEKAWDLEKPVETDALTNRDLLNEAYDRCGEVCAEYAKTFYLGTCSSASSLYLCDVFEWFWFTLFFLLFIQLFIHS